MMRLRPILAVFLIATLVNVLPGCKSAAALNPAIGHATATAGRVDKTFETQAGITQQLKAYVSAAGQPLLDTLNALTAGGTVDALRLSEQLSAANADNAKAWGFAARETKRADAAEGTFGYRAEQSVRHWSRVALTVVASGIGAWLVGRLVGSAIGGPFGGVLVTMSNFILHVSTGLISLAVKVVAGWRSEAVAARSVA